MSIRFIPASLPAMAQLEALPIKKGTENNDNSLQIEWQNLLNISNSEEFKVNYPVTAAFLSEFQQKVNEYSSEEILKYRSYILEIYKREKAWNSYNITINFNKNDWELLESKIKDTTFNFKDKYPTTYVYLSQLGTHTDKLKALIFELSKKEELFISGKITKDEFDLFLLKIHVEFFREYLSISLNKITNTILKIKKIVPQKKDLNYVSLAHIKLYPTSYPYTNYFLKDKQSKTLADLTNEEQSEMKNLMGIDEKIKLLNSAFSELEKIQGMIYAVRTWLYSFVHDFSKNILQNKNRNTENNKLERSRAEVEIDEICKPYFNLKWDLEIELRALSKDIHYELLNTGVIKALPETRKLFSGIFISPNVLEKIIEVIELLPLDLIKIFIKTNSDVYFEIPNDLFMNILENKCLTVRGQANSNITIDEKTGKKMCQGTAMVFVYPKKLEDFEYIAEVTIHEMAHIIEHNLEDNPAYAEWWKKFQALASKRIALTYLCHSDKVYMDTEAMCDLIFIKTNVNGKEFEGFVPWPSNTDNCNKSSHIFTTCLVHYIKYLRQLKAQRNNSTLSVHSSLCRCNNNMQLDKELFNLFEELFRTGQLLPLLKGGF